MAVEHTNEIEQIAELLAPQPEGATIEEEPEEAQETVEEPQPTQDLADEQEETDEAPEEGSSPDEPPNWESLGVTKEQVYDIDIPMPNAEPIKLGDLKNRYLDMVRDTDSSTSQQMESERQLAAERAALVDALALVPDPSPEQQQALQRYQAVQLDREIKKTLARIPDWQDQSVYQADMGSMTTLAEKYGMTKAELEATVDSRAIHMLRDFARLQERVDKAMQHKPEPPAPAKKTTKRKQVATDKRTRLNKQIDKAKQSGSHNEKVDAITALLMNS